MGSLRIVPAGDWVVVAAWPTIVALPGRLDDDAVQEVWAAVTAPGPVAPGSSIEQVVSSIPTRGADSFAVVRFDRDEDQGGSDPDAGWAVTVVVRGRAAVDLLSVGGSRRFGAQGARPWALAEFAAVTGVSMGELPATPESPIRLPPGSIRLDHGVARASRVVWASSPESLADEEPADEEPADEEPADEEPADEEPADEEPADREPADEEPADREAADEPAPVRPPHPGFTVRVDEGPEHPLDAPVVIGRDPRARPAAARPGLLIAVDSPSRQVSANHVEIAPSGRTAVVSDLRSTNGSTVRPAGLEPVRMRPGDSVVLTGSAIVEIGDGHVIHISSRDRGKTGITV